MVLVANKFDLIESIESEGEDKLEEFMTQSYLEQFAMNNGFVGVLRTSAKTGFNINTAFSAVVREIFKREI
jgi:hypothetical protein